MWVNCCLLRGSTAQTCRGEQPLWFIVQLGSLILTQEFLNSVNSIKAAQITKIKFWKKKVIWLKCTEWTHDYKFLKISKWKNMKSKKDHTKRPQQLASIITTYFKYWKKSQNIPFSFFIFSCFHCGKLTNSSLVIPKTVVKSVSERYFCKWGDKV